MCELPSAFKSITRKAAKAHKCCECGSDINKGESYQYSSGIWNGEPDSYKQCLNCYEILTAADIYGRKENLDPIGFGELNEWFFGYMCRDFKGIEFLNGMAEMINVKPKKLNRLLQIN
jgi:hypothetical protein